MTVKFLNRQAAGDHTYIVGFKVERGVVYARSEGQARQLAIEHWKPKKREKNDVFVSLHYINADVHYVEEEGHA